MEEKRSSFSGKLGFILAAAGSAVGLGNIWRFPYLASEYGGGIFLLVYIALSLTFGFALMVAEIAIGRKTRKSPICAYKSLHKKWSFLGVLATIVPVLVLPYYSVIGGWVTKYAFGFIAGQGSAMAGDAFFGSFISSAGEPVLWFGIFLIATAIIVLLGVEKGIEKVSKFIMPALVVLMLFIVIYTLCTTDGAWEGVLYYITPDFSKFSVMTVVAAAGQLFYSMSLAMGIMITFGSFMKKDDHIEKATHKIEIFDTGIAILAGLMIVPACFAFAGGSAENMQSGPGLMFGVLPKIFETMPAGGVIGAVFFIMVFFAALTSAISLMQTVASTIQDRFNLSQKVSTIIVTVGSFALGLLSCFGYSIFSGFEILGKQMLDFFDFITNSALMPLIALLTCIFVGYILKPKTLIEEVQQNGKFKQKGLFTIVIRYVAPVCLAVILVSSILSAFNVITI